MKTNRQKNKVVRQTFAQHLKAKDNKIEERVTLKELLKKGVEGQMANLVCREKLAIVLQDSINTVGVKGTLMHKNVYLRGGTKNALKECLANWQIHPTQVYIFAPTHPPESIRSFRTSQTDFAKNTPLGKTASETAFNFYPQKPSLSHTESTPSLNPSEKSMNRLLSQKCLNPPESEQMFVVEEVGESMQSDPKSSFKSNQDKQNREVTNLANLNFYNPKQTQNYLQNLQRQQQSPQQTPIELQCEQKMHKTKANEPWSLQKQKQPNSPSQPQKEQSNNQQQLKQSYGQSRFSFTTHMRHGLLRLDPSTFEPEASLAVVGDDQIQQEKNRLKGQSLNSEIGSMSQLSSIVSTVREDGGRKEAEQNSIKHDLEDMNKYCPRQSLEKLNLHVLAEQREQRFDDRIHVTSKAENANEYTVRYDVRFVKRTAVQPTEVIRLSPLRFRKREETGTTTPAKGESSRPGS